LKSTKYNVGKYAEPPFHGVIGGPQKGNGAGFKYKLELGYQVRCFVVQDELFVFLLLGLR
jgi:hypothetical protein